MFHQVKVLPEDADPLRFLWWDAAPRQPPKEYKMLVHIFGATSSPCCANRALRQTADDNKGQYSPEVITTIYRNFYVDDVLKSVQTTDQAIWIAEQLTKLLREGGFHLTKFTSNSQQVLEALPQDKRANLSINLDLNQLPVGRTLGLHWNAASDTFQFKVVPTNKPPTKRGILSTVTSLYDPLGFLGPFILPVKIILQELWRIAVQWDDPISEPLLTRWNKWIESLPLVANIKIPRCSKSFSLRVIRDVQMHYFSDASNDGYAAVGYLRLVDDTGKIHCAFVMGKTRNSPLRQWSMLIEGTLPVGGRIRHAPITFEAAHPMLLPKEHPISSLIVCYYHELLGHTGREHVLSAMRQHFWIIQARSLVRHVLRKCIACHKRNKAPMKQLMADLPKERLTPHDPPFT